MENNIYICPDPDCAEEITISNDFNDIICPKCKRHVKVPKKKRRPYNDDSMGVISENVILS